MGASCNIEDKSRLEFPELKDALKKLIAKHSRGDVLYKTAIPNVSIFCVSKSETPSHLVYEPCFCLAAQGAKRVILSNDSYLYDSRNYLIASASIPTTVQVVKASPAAPYYGFKLKLDSELVSQSMLEKVSPAAPCRFARAIGLGKTSAPLLEAVCRLLSLLDTPNDIPVLSPLIQKEIIYRLLCGSQGFRLRQILTEGSPSNRISNSMDWLKNNFTEKVKIENLAQIARMSVSAFHRHFKEVTSMSPLQYQKALRLQEAKRQMMFYDIDVATAAYKVGYESPTQFNREYKRFFGNPPRQDILSRI